MSRFKSFRIFGLGESKEYAEKICSYLGESLSKHEEVYFDDGECYVRSELNVRGGDVFVISSLYNSKDSCLADKVMNLLFFVGSLRDASAARITIVLPYMAYQRQDRKNKSRAPIYTKYFPMILESVCKDGDRLLVVDPHNLSAFQSGNRTVNDHLEARNLFVRKIKHEMELEHISPEDVVIMSPDEGGTKRIRHIRNGLSKLMGQEFNLAYVDKTHANDGSIEAHRIVGDVKDKKVIVFDDMISSGKTMLEANKAVQRSGGTMWACCATHGLCVGRADEYIGGLLDEGIKVFMTDTVKPLALSDVNYSRVDVVSTVELIAEGIRCIHNEESISRLLY